MRNHKVLGVSVGAAAASLFFVALAYACTNYVGELDVVGNNINTSTVSVTGSQSWNELSQAMTQSVSAGVAKANSAQSGTGNFRIWTGPNTSQTGNQWRLGNGASSTTFDVNYFDGGSTTDGYAYTNHTTWNNPNGDCMSWLVPSSNVTKLGTVTIDANGNISGGGGTYFVSFDTTTKYAWFKWDNNHSPAKVSVSPKESGVCVSDQVGSVNGNQAPLTVV